MKKYLRWLILIVIAFALSVFITRSDISYNASPCLYTEVCQEKTLGTKKTVQYGFPASYKQVTTFTPKDSSKYGLVDQGGDISYALIATNVVFWLAVLMLLPKLVTKLKKHK